MQLTKGQYCKSRTQHWNRFFADQHYWNCLANRGTLQKILKAIRDILFRLTSIYTTSESCLFFLFCDGVNGTPTFEKMAIGNSLLQLIATDWNKGVAKKDFGEFWDFGGFHWFRHILKNLQQISGFYNNEWIYLRGINPDTSPHINTPMDWNDCETDRVIMTSWSLVCVGKAMTWCMASPSSVSKNA